MSTEKQTVAGERTVARKYYVLTDGKDFQNRRSFTAYELEQAEMDALVATGGNCYWIEDSVQSDQRPSFSKVSPLPKRV